MWKRVRFGSALHRTRLCLVDGTPIITVEHLGERGVVHSNLPTESDADESGSAYMHLKKVISYLAASVTSIVNARTSRADAWLALSLGDRFAYVLFRAGYQRIDVTLSETCVFENGDRGKNYPSSVSFARSGVPFVNAGHVAEGHINRSELDYITRESYDRLGGGKFKPGDILFCLRGSLGKFGIVGPDFGEGAIASSLVIVRPKSASLRTDYLSYYFNSNLCARMIENGLVVQLSLISGARSRKICNSFTRLAFRTRSHCRGLERHGRRDRRAGSQARQSPPAQAGHDARVTHRTSQACLMEN